MHSSGSQIRLRFQCVVGSTLLPSQSSPPIYLRASIGTAKCTCTILHGTCIRWDEHKHLLSPKLIKCINTCYIVIRQKYIAINNTLCTSNAHTPYTIKDSAWQCKKMSTAYCFVNIYKTRVSDAEWMDTICSWM